jgi:hypothetical protein
LLTIPTEGYVETSGGPVPLREVEWIELSTVRVVGGLAGHPRRMVDIKADILAELAKTQLVWKLGESTWSMAGIFAEEPVQVIRLPNPLGLSAVPFS